MQRPVGSHIPTPQMIIMKEPYCDVCENKMRPFIIRNIQLINPHLDEHGSEFEYCSKCGIVRKVLP